MRFLAKFPAAVFLLCTTALLAPAQTRHTLQTPVIEQAPLIDEFDKGPAQDASQPLQDMVEAMQVMQDTYFDMFAGTWSGAIDWTAAVTGTYISSTLSSIADGVRAQSNISSCAEMMKWDNKINQFYTQSGFFYFGENAFALRNQAFDDMLWVVLGWLESIKFSSVYSAQQLGMSARTSSEKWHGSQLSPLAAHRARIFYDLASHGWGEDLCSGGMTWNPNLTPYKNAITNELFAAASISMYLYFPGDDNNSPFFAQANSDLGKAQDAVYLKNAVKAYRWLQQSNMRSSTGLYQDGYHVSGWRRNRNGTIDRGTGKCDILNTMVYTYNQGVILTASRGLWIATGARSYLDEGHELVNSVITATGWLHGDKNIWHGLGRDGILEEFCDHQSYCSQDGQTFKGIFMHHLTEFCRPLRELEKELFPQALISEAFSYAYGEHLRRCATYKAWIDHNAEAVLRTKNNAGLFGMWWGAPSRDNRTHRIPISEQQLPDGAVDHLNTRTGPKNQRYDNKSDLNDRGRGRTVETQGGALAALKARWQWHSFY